MKLFVARGLYTSMHAPAREAVFYYKQFGALAIN